VSLVPEWVCFVLEREIIVYAMGLLEMQLEDAKL
jgi:hypothetical protein